MGLVLGMDVESVRATARILNGQFAGAGSIATRARQTGAASRSPGSWGLAPGDRALAPWDYADVVQAASGIDAAIAAAAQLVNGLYRDADQQEAASRADTAGSPIPAPALSAEERARATATLAAAQLSLLLALAVFGSEPSADILAALWQRISEDEAVREQFILDNPRIGNLPGIPLDDRIRANAEQARQMLEDGTVSGTVADYLRQVADGDRSLVIFDPAGERIVEMIGTPGPDTRKVITYVPGTDASMDSFYDGSVQQVSEFLVGRDTSGSTVAFVYKDGPWVTWFGDRANSNADFLRSEGEKLAGFQESLDLDPHLAGVDRVGIAHSAGNTVLSYSEIHGAEYDSYLSLSGSWIDGAWSPSNGTGYHHYQYGYDAINYLDPFSSTPAESSLFEQNRYTPESWMNIQNEFANHGRIAEGPGTNLPALEGMYQDIWSGSSSAGGSEGNGYSGGGGGGGGGGGR